MSEHVAAAPKFKTNSKAKQRAKHAGFHIALIVLSLIFLIPIFYMLSVSLMGEVESGSGAFLPSEIHWENYALALNSSFLNWFKNSLIVVVVNIIAIPLSASFTAFGFTRCKFKGSGVLFAVILCTMMVPAVVSQIPLYVIYVRIGWLNTLWPLIVPGILGGGAGNIFLARQFMRTISPTMDEAAVIDGANRFQVFFWIYLPLSQPIIVYMMIQTFTGMWNDVVTPLLYLRREDSYTLALGIYNQFLGAYTPTMYDDAGNVTVVGTFPNIRMATGMYMLIPCAIVFFIFQKQLIDGVQMGAVKG